MKKSIVLLLSFMLLLFTACQNETATEATDAAATESETTQAATDAAQPDATEEATGFTPGTYSGTAQGHGGPITLEVTLDEDSITDIQMVQTSETVAVGDTAFETIKQFVLDNQSLDIDNVSGATVTSAAVRSALRDAIEQSGADISALQDVPVSEAAVPEDTETQVVVIGSGLAGMAAAIEAADTGSDVILVEKLGRFGGTTALSAGWIHAAGTDIQEKNGVEDSAEKFFEDWMMLAERANDEFVDENLVRIITDNSADNIVWLQEHGVKLMDDIFAAGIYEGRNVDRIHQTEGGNGYIIKYLYDTAVDLGIDMRNNTRAMEIVKEGDTVTGVKVADNNGNEYTIHANAVVVAAGGLAGNPEMMKEYFPQYTDYENYSVNTGDTISMGKLVGADIIVKNAAQIHHQLSTDSGLGYFTPECIYVTPEGERYVDEAEYFYTRTRLLNEKGFGDTHMIIPQMLYDQHKEGIDKAFEIGKAFKADTVEELAELMAMNPETLNATITRYNELVDKGVDEDFNKPAEFLHRIEAPYIGLDLTGNLNDTYVSLRINENAQVLDEQGQIINGLYAAGAAASAQTLNQEYIGSGSALLNGLTFGRIAGAHASETLQQAE